MTGSSYGLTFSNFLTSIHEFSNSNAVVRECYQNWHEVAKTQLNELVHLPNGWDGYRGKPVSFENAYFTMQMLASICGPETAEPQIVPGTSGDLQVEWHTHEGDIELHIHAPNDVHAWYSLVGDNPVEEELRLTYDFTDVVEWVHKIAERPIAPVAAAA